MRWLGKLLIPLFYVTLIVAVVIGALTSGNEKLQAILLVLLLALSQGLDALLALSAWGLMKLAIVVLAFLVFLLWGRMGEIDQRLDKLDELEEQEEVGALKHRLDDFEKRLEDITSARGGESEPDYWWNEPNPPSMFQEFHEAAVWERCWRQDNHGKALSGLRQRSRTEYVRDTEAHSARVRAELDRS